MSQRPRVLFLLQLPPPTHGSSMVGLSIRQSSVINVEFDCAYVNLMASRHVAESGRVSLGKVFRFAFIWWAVLREVVAARPALCHLALTTTGAAFVRDVLLIAILRAFGVKRVFHLHNKGVSAQRSWLMSRVLYPFAFGGAQVILLSPRLYADVERHVPRQMVHICPNGIATAAGEAAGAEREASNIVRLLFLSNLIESKGVFDLLDACSLLKRGGAGFHCTLVGGEGDIGAERLRLAIEQRGLSEVVTYLGAKFGAEKDRVLRNADVFVLPTYYPSECFPLVLLEAMSYGLPVVTTDEGGIADIVEDGATGYVVPRRDARALAQRLGTLVGARALRQEMGERARRKYLRDYTLESFERRLAGILREIVATR